MRIAVRKHKAVKFLHYAAPLMCVILVTAIGSHVFLNRSHAASPCTVSAILVNSCHPLLAAYSQGYNLGSGFADTGPSVAQTQAAEQRAGRQFDVIHSSYHEGAGGDTLTSEETYFATKTNQTVFLNWWPTKDWADGGGGTSAAEVAVNQEIDNMAASVKQVAPVKVMITIQHEMNDKVSALDSPNDSTCPANVSLPGSSGTPAQYRAMFINVENRFKADGVSNAVWAILFESFNQDNDNAFPNCLDGALYPGNQYIDWVGFDTYGNGSTSPSSNSDGSPSGNGAFQETAGKTYQYLESLSGEAGTTFGMMNKPVVLGEFSSCQSGYTPQQNADYFEDAKYALDSHLYPDIQLYMVFDAPGTGNSSPGGCMLGYTNAGQQVPGNIIQVAFNSFANDQIFTGSTSTSTSVVLTAPSNSSTVSGIVPLAATATPGTGLSIANVTFKLTGAGVTSALKTDTSTPYTDSWNSANVANGTYTITAIATDSGGSTTQSAVTINVGNKQTATTITAPTDISSPSQTTSSISLKWNASQDSGYAASNLTYVISRNGTQIATTTAGTTAYTDAGLSPNTTYSYTISASDPAGETSTSSAAFTQATLTLNCQAPAAPASFSGTATAATSVNLSWNAVSPPSNSCTISHYVLERNGIAIAQPTNITYSDSAVSAASTYTYSVLAVTVDNTAGSASTVEVTTPAAQQTDPGPTAPSSLTATALADTQINLVWTASTDSVAGIKQYNILRNGTQVGIVAPTTGSVLSFGDSELSPRTTYSYQVIAVSGGGKTTASANVQAETLSSMSSETTTSSTTHNNNTGSESNIPILAGTTSVGSDSETGSPTSADQSSVPTNNNDQNTRNTTINNRAGSKNIHKTLPVTVHQVAFASTGVFSILIIFVGGIWLLHWRSMQYYHPAKGLGKLKITVVHPETGLYTSSTRAITDTPALDKVYKKRKSKDKEP